MSLLQTRPVEPTPPPGEMPTQPGAGSAEGIGQLAHPEHGPRGEQTQGPYFINCLPHGLRLVFIVRQSGNEEWFAVCDRHLWMSVGDGRAIAEGACCPCCEADRETLARRARFVGEYGWWLFHALFAARSGR